ncbi:MAG: hypothetical protein ACOC12_02515 [Bacteroidota bacterium]
MKKLILLLTGLFLMINVASSQGIDDRAVIPVSITLNSILRLNVTSGGNIEFNFNTLNDYENGIPSSAAYETRFNVASSVDWDVLMYSENANLVGTDIVTAGGNTANSMDLDNIGYHISHATLGDITTDYDTPSGDAANPTPLTSDPATELVGYNGALSNAGDINKNSFVIHWRCGTQEGTMRGETILSQGIAADRYSTNVFLILQPTN